MKRKFILASVLFIAASFLMAPAQAQQKNNNKNAAIKGSFNVTTDYPEGAGEATINYVEDGHRYKFRLNGSKIVEMTLDGKKVPEEDFSKYEDLVKNILAQIEKDREQAMKDREQAVRDREQANKDRAQAEKDRQQAEKDREQANQDRKKGEEDRAEAERDREQAKKDRAQAELDREQAAIDRKQAEEDRKLFDAMINELVQEKLVESRGALVSLAMDETELLINGKVQPENVHRRYKDKFLKGKNNRINYRNSSGSRQLSFD